MWSEDDSLPQVGKKHLILYGHSVHRLYIPTTNQSQNPAWDDHWYTLEATSTVLPVIVSKYNIMKAISTMKLVLLVSK